MKQACILAQQVIDKINVYSEEYTTEDGKFVTTADSLEILNSIIEHGFTLCKYVIEKEICQGIKEMEAAAYHVYQHMEKLSVDNAKKLQLDSAVQLWQQSKIAIALLACSVLDHGENIQ